MSDKLKSIDGRGIYMDKIGNFKKFIITLSIGIIALLAEFVFGKPDVAFCIVAIMGGVIAFTMLLDMIQTLKSGRYGVDILAITAIVSTLVVHEYWASLMVLIMLTGGDSLEDYASRQAGKELHSLLSHSPQVAHVLTGETMTDVSVEDITIGQRILVKPGEIIPVDGIVIEGETSVDEASLTGESLPVDKKIGDTLMSGSINGDNSIKFEVRKVAKDSQYQRIVRLVEESEAKPAHFVRMADRYAVPFTLVAYLIGGIAWFISKDPVRFAEVMVVASPCPLILAAPIALVAGMSRTSRNGIVVKTGTTIEKIAAAKSVAFDKTGTITAGTLRVLGITTTDAYSESDVLVMAASVEKESAHILARSLLAAIKEKKLDLLPVSNVEEITGEGVKGIVEGKQVTVGKKTLIKSDLPIDDSQETSVYVSSENQYIGKITFQDMPRQEAKSTMERLRGLGIKHLLMITGDKQVIAQKIAEKVGIQEIYANCLPQEKIDLLNNLPEEQRPVIMVGDGINDTPALAIADVGIAMGAHGSTAASESADAVIINDDLMKVATAVDISKQTMKIARQSVLIGIFICVALMLIASFGVIPTLVGAMLQELVDTVSILTALRAKND